MIRIFQFIDHYFWVFRSVFACFDPFSGEYKQVPVKILSVTKIKFDSKMRLFKLSLAFLAISAETEVIFSLFFDDKTYKISTRDYHLYSGKSIKCYQIFGSKRKIPTIHLGCFFWKKRRKACLYILNACR